MSHNLPKRAGRADRSVRTPHPWGAVGGGAVARTSVGAAILACVAAGCSGHSTAQNATTQSSTTSSTDAPNATAVAEEQALAQYRAFWAHIDAASAASGMASKRAILSPYATDPELSSLVATFTEDNAKGQVAYGSNVLRPEIVAFSVGRGVAAIHDCQDSSHAGTEVAATHKPLTVGPTRNPVNTTLHLAQGLWKVSFVQYPGGTC